MRFLTDAAVCCLVLFLLFGTGVAVFVVVITVVALVAVVAVVAVAAVAAVRPVWITFQCCNFSGSHSPLLLLM